MSMARAVFLLPSVAMVAHPVRKADETTALLAVSLRKSRRDIAESSLTMTQLLQVSFDRDYYRDGDIVNFDIGSSIPFAITCSQIFTTSVFSAAPDIWIQS